MFTPLPPGTPQKNNISFGRNREMFMWRNVTFQPPVCVEGENIIRRRRRREVTEVDGNGNLRDVEPEIDENLTIEVFTGLYVNEEPEVSPFS